MLDTASSLLRAAHIVGGLGALWLGALAALLPKVGAAARWHRLAGQGYALCMLLMGLASLPLSWQQHSTVLLVVGPLTLLWVVWGWLSLRRARQAWQAGQPGRAARLLRQHVSLMGLSYLATWTAFLQNRQPFGGGALAAWTAVLLPAVVGSLLIVRAVRRLTTGQLTPVGPR